MSRWLDRTLAPVDSTHSGVAFVHDPDCVVDVAGLKGEVMEVRDWWTLRGAYERAGRRRPADAGRLTFVIRGLLAAEPIPWDIERASAVTVRVRLPGPPAVRAIIAGLDGEEADRVIQAVETAVDPSAAVVTCLAGVAVSARPLSRTDQLRLASRLLVCAQRPSGLSALARHWLAEPLTAALLDEPPDLAPLQDEWARFIGSGQSSWKADFESAQAELGQLFAAGLLESVTASSDVPTWTTVGVRSPTNEERAEHLLAERPVPFPPADLEGWWTLAEWWGDVRRLIAGARHQLQDHAWEVWTQVDAAFLPWLRNHYGRALSSAARWPAAVHRVAHLLARRLRDGDAERVMLVVLDGLGHAQWAHLKQRLLITEATSGSTLALVPTYTTVSRQALFAGDLPTTYPQSLWTTQYEPRRWRAFWEGEGVRARDTTYWKVKGRYPHDRIDFGAELAVGVVVNALDDLMHTSELFGDAQLLANLDVWADNGFFYDLVQRADAVGFEVWITADHGNLECLPTRAPSEGVGIEAAGKRLLRYPNQILRDTSDIDGIVWDDIPGLPASAEPLRFAPGRLAYTNHRLSISHGGLSLDEVVVPLARVKP